MGEGIKKAIKGLTQNEEEILQSKIDKLVYDTKLEAIENEVLDEDTTFPKYLILYMCLFMIDIYLYKQSVANGLSLIWSCGLSLFLIVCPIYWNRQKDKEVLKKLKEHEE